MKNKLHLDTVITKIALRSDGDYDVTVYDGSDDNLEDNDVVDDVVCTGTLEDAQKWAQDIVNEQFDLSYEKDKKRLKRYPYLGTMTAMEILKADVVDEKFNIPFVCMLEKFVEEYDDMEQMELMRRARQLLKEKNEQ